MCAEISEQTPQHFNKNAENLQTDVNSFICPHNNCGKKFLRRSHYNRHLKGHSGIKPYSCSFCSNKYLRLEHLKRHENTHTGEIKYTCQFTSCGKSFNNSTHLKRHQSVHYKKLTCDVCHKGFSKTHLYTQHTRLHQYTSKKTDDDRYLCPFSSCERPYSTISGLRKHIKCHENPKDHSCNICKISFVRFSDFAKHRKSNHPKTFDCLRCKRSFKRNSLLKIHLKHVHMEFEDTENYVFVCAASGCSRSFNSQRSLSAHFNRSHSIRNSNQENSVAPLSRVVKNENNQDNSYNLTPSDSPTIETEASFENKSLFTTNINHLLIKSIDISETTKMPDLSEHNSSLTSTLKSEQSNKLNSQQTSKSINTQSTILNDSDTLNFSPSDSNSNIYVDFVNF